MNLDERAIRLSALLLPPRLREDHLEEWLADLAGARELGIPSSAIARGAALFAVTNHRWLKRQLTPRESEEFVMNITTGIRLVGFTLLAALGAVATFVAIQSLQDTSQMGYAFVPGGPVFDTEVPALVFSVLILATGLAMLTITFRRGVRVR